MKEFERLFSISGLSLDRMRAFLLVAGAGGVSAAAKGDPVRQSQYSRQLKELEGYFGIPLTRLVGRRIQITPQGYRLADMIRRHFSELDDFRESSVGRPVCVRIGAQGSVLDWLLLPTLSGIRETLGGALIEFEQLRSAEIVAAVSDGRLDFGVVRADAVHAGMKKWRLGELRYSVFAPVAVWRSHVSPEVVLGTLEMGGLLPGGEFQGKLEEWYSEHGITPRIVARMPSFLQVARLTRISGLPSVLPEIASAEFDPRRISGRRPRWKLGRELVLIVNRRAIDRSGIPDRAVAGLKALLSGALSAFEH